MADWKKVATGVAAAAVGAGIFGAVHFMFLAQQAGTGDIMGIPFTVVIPFLLGTAGFVISGMWGKLTGTAKDIVQFGSAAAIGFGIAQYAGWLMTPATAARAAARYVPSPAIRTITPTITPTVQGTKMI